MLNKCVCAHPAQDKLHGPGVRVWNETAKTEPQQQYRCTVCGAEKALGGAVAAPKKDKAKK